MTAPRDIRHRLGLSVREFAAALGVSRRTVEGWEQGRPVGRLAELLIERTFGRIPRRVHSRPRRGQAPPRPVTVGEGNDTGRGE